MEELKRVCEELKEDPLGKSQTIIYLLQELTSQLNERNWQAIVECLVDFFGEESPVKEWKRKPEELNDNEKVFLDWYKDSNRHFRSLLLNVFNSDASNSFKILILDTTMKLISSERDSEFNNELFREVVNRLMVSATSVDVLEHLVEEYGRLADVRYFLLQGIAYCCRNNTTFHPHPENILKVLLALPKTFSLCVHDEDGTIKSLTRISEGYCAVPAITGYPKQRKRRRLEHASNQIKGFKWMDSKEQEKQFSSAWKYFLCLELSPEILLKVLDALPLNVIPYLSSPLILSDFLTGALDNSGLIGLLALHSIFILMTQHNLEYPSFYKQVYGLLQAEVFTWEEKQKFFRMLNSFLKTELIPAYTIAAFIKKFARLALHADPSGALISITFIHNLIRRHPSCYILLHKPPVTQNIDDWRQFDRFDEKATDPSQSRAIESSLWEMEALGNHWCPQVATYAEILLKDLTQRITTSEESLQLPLKASYSTLIQENLERAVSNETIQTNKTFFGSDLIGWDLSGR